MDWLDGPPDAVRLLCRPCRRSSFFNGAQWTNADWQQKSVCVILFSLGAMVSSL